LYDDDNDDDDDDDGDDAKPTMQNVVGLYSRLSVAFVDTLSLIIFAMLSDVKHQTVDPKRV